MFNRRNQISVGIAQTGAVLRIDDIGIQGPDFRFSRQIDTTENNSRIRRRRKNRHFDAAAGMKTDTA